MLLSRHCGFRAPLRGRGYGHFLPNRPGSGARSIGGILTRGFPLVFEPLTQQWRTQGFIRSLLGAVASLLGKAPSVYHRAGARNIRTSTPSRSGSEICLCGCVPQTLSTPKLDLQSCCASMESPAKLEILCLIRLPLMERVVTPIYSLTARRCTMRSGTTGDTIMAGRSC